MKTMKHSLLTLTIASIISQAHANQQDTINCNAINSFAANNWSNDLSDLQINDYKSIRSNDFSNYLYKPNKAHDCASENASSDSLEF